MSSVLPFPVEDLHFIDLGLKMSPSTDIKSRKCNFYLYHHKVLHSPPKPEPSMPPIVGRFGHRMNDLYFDLLDADTLFSFQSPMDIAKFIIRPMPGNMDPKFTSKIIPSILGFSKYEYDRFCRLEELLGEKDEIWHYYCPLAHEYEVDEFTIGINMWVDVIYPIPKDLYGSHPSCIEVADYKTGKIPPCALGLKTEKDTGSVVKVPITMPDDVEEQLMFEVLFLKYFGFLGNPSPRIDFAKVIYTGGPVTVTQPVTDRHLEKVFEHLKELQDKIEHNSYLFNSWECNKMYCDYGHVCLRSVDMDLFDDRARIIHLYKEDKVRAGQLLMQRVNEIHERLVERAGRPGEQKREVKEEEVFM